MLDAAYNDSAGVTAEFNRNVLRVINRHLDADFDVARFEHVAFFNREQLADRDAPARARGARVTIARARPAASRSPPARPFTPRSAASSRAPTCEAMLGTAGFALARWYTPANGYFGLALARAV